MRPGPLHNPRARRARRRDAVSANSLEGWIGCSYAWFVDHELHPERLEPVADPLWLGSIVHEALERLYREAPGEDTIPRPATSGAGSSAWASCSASSAPRRRAAPSAARRIARAQAQVEAFLDEEAASETPTSARARDLLEWSFGLDEDELDPLRLGELRVHGIVDRVDVARDGQGAVVRDYKTSKKVHGAQAFEDRGLLQLPLYMRAVGEILGLDSIAGIYHPLAAYGEPPATRDRA